MKAMYDISVVLFQSVVLLLHIKVDATTVQLDATTVQQLEFEVTILH